MSYEYYECVVLEQTSSSGRRISSYCYCRLDDLEASELITGDEVNLLFEEVREEMKLPPFDQWDSMRGLMDQGQEPPIDDPEDATPDPARET